MPRSTLRWSSPFLAAAVALGLVHCSGGSFDVAGTPADDTGTTTDGTTTDSPGLDGTGSDGTSSDGIGGDGIPGDVPTFDGIVPDGIVSDGIGTDGGTACVSLGTDATELYVDQSSTLPSVGTAACPFKTIHEATVLGATSGTSTRTIHVKSGSYSETALVDVAGRVVLQGDGASITKITGHNPAYGYSAAVAVEQGGIVDGFTVLNSGIGSAMVLNAGTISPGSAAATVRNCIANGNPENGIVALGSAEIGPKLQASSNTKVGLLVIGSGNVHVSNTGGSNSFDSNGEQGIFFSSGSSLLVFDGGSANTNGFAGIRLATAPSTTATHRISNLVARNNGTGVSVSTANLVLRTSTLNKNKSFGLVFNYGTGGTQTLDIGTTLVSSPGNNVFGTTAEKNTNAGICLVNSGPPSSQAADTDKFSVCPPTQAPGICDGTGSYADVWYNTRMSSATLGLNPLVATSCSSI